MARSACVQGCEGARYDRLTALPPAIALLVDATLGARAAQAVARDNGLLLSHANRGWEAISELEEWKRRGAYASEAADRVLPCVASEDLGLEEVGVVEENGVVALVSPAVDCVED